MKLWWWVVVGGGVGWWLRVILVLSFDLSQAEQFLAKWGLRVGGRVVYAQSPGNSSHGQLCYCSSTLPCVCVSYKPGR